MRRSSLTFTQYIHTTASLRSPVEQEMARRPGQGVETRGGWKTTLQHIIVGPPAALVPGGGEDVGDTEGCKRVPHVPLKVRVTMVTFRYSFGAVRWYVGTA